MNLNKILYRNKRGMSLAELMVTIPILSLIILALYLVFNTGQYSYRTENARMELNQELRRTMDWMMQDLPEGGLSTLSTTEIPADGQPHSSITFKTATGVSSGETQWSTNTIQYLLNPSDNSQLIRRSGGVDKIIASNVTSFSVTRQASSPRVIEVSLTVSQKVIGNRNQTQTLNFQIDLRN